MKPITRNMWREIGHAKGRFVAIVLIILLGVLIFVGVKAAGPALNDSAAKTVTDQKLSDVTILSSTGFSKADVAAIDGVSGGKAEAVSFKYVIGGKSDRAVALYGYDAGLKQNQLMMVSGHQPRHENEIVLDEQAKTNDHYKLGQNYRFAKSAGLKRQTYKIVGFANSPMYLDNSQRGAANVGDGSVRYFAYIPEKQLNLPAPTMITVRFANLQHLNPFTAAYRDAINKKVTALKRVGDAQAAKRQDELQRQVTANFKRPLAQLNQTQRQLRQAGITSGEQFKQLETAHTRLMTRRQTALAETRTTYTWQTRDDLPGFEAYGDSSDRIAAIANVFPVFFFLIAALITFTTITRMVEEARSQIGTFKALGYSRWAIARNYLLYALAAGLLGCVLGAVIGNVTLPRIVLALYQMYIPLTPVNAFQWGTIGVALAFSLLATVGAALIVVRRQLAEGPAALMLPKAPKSAKRILLERITPLWRRLSFNQKVSYRNLFRFKSRMLMTIIGIAGGTALILTGFGIRDSITDTSQLQYGTASHYQAVMRLSTSKDEVKAQRMLEKNGQYRSSVPVYMATVKVKTTGHQVPEGSLIVPEQTNQLAKAMKLTPKGKRQAGSLPHSGVLLSQKMADLLKVKPGGMVTVDSGHQTPKIRVAGVMENYVGHYLAMSSQTYERAFDNPMKVNTLLVMLTHQNAAQRNKLAQTMLASGTVTGTSYVADQQKTITNMAASLTGVVAIFILLSAILSFVVLYNLTNINVSERIRELSTIKVLGFFDREVTMYIVRENIVMTLVGIVCGYGLGWLLTAYIMRQAATALVAFPVVIHWPGIVVATVLMLFFTAIVMGLTHRRLKRVDMVSALAAKE